MAGAGLPGFFTGSGEKICQEEFYRRLEISEARMVMMGENHQDPLAHQIELEVLRRLSENDAGVRVGLSLEFWDRESQVVLDEYLAGLVPLDTFLRDSRPPSNHSSYYPLLELCRQSNLPVVAANCPRRYSRLVSKSGQAALLPMADTAARSLLPPLPYPPASPEYQAAFLEIMREMGSSSIPPGMIEAQALWDASMADSLVKSLTRMDRVVHVTGYFHVQHGLGTVERVRDLTDTKVMTVVVLPSEQRERLGEGQTGLADLVVLSDINEIPD